MMIKVLTGVLISQKKDHVKEIRNEFNYKEQMKNIFHILFGYVLVFSSSLVKLPQLYLIFSHKTGSGISRPALYLEILVNVFSLIYHRKKEFPFETYGECSFILAQNLLILCLIYLFDEKRDKFQKKWMIFPFLQCIIFLSPVILNEFGLLSISIVAWLYYLCLPLSLIRKLPQIILTHKIKIRGVLSPITAALTLFASFGRLLTTYFKLHDVSIMIFNIFSCILNSILFIQTLIYPRTRTYDDEIIL